MTRRWLGVLCAACVWSAAYGCASRPGPAFTLSIVGTNDLHGGVTEVNGRGGLALLDGYLSNLRAARQKDGGAVLLLDAGDLYQGTLESNLNEGAAVTDAYNAIGYQAAAVGNHEFDYGPVGASAVPHAPGDDPRGALKARLAQARFPFLAANLVDTATGTPVSLPNVAPSVMLTINGVKVGIVGLLTEPAMSYTTAANVEGLVVTPLVKALVDEATALRGRGASVVIALAHAGSKCGRVDDPLDISSCEPNAEIFEVARKVPAGLVDAIVAGHRHEPVAHEVHGIPIIQSYWRGRAFGRIDVVVDRLTGRVQSHHIFQPRDLCEQETPGAAGCALPGAANARRAEYEGQGVTASARIAAILQPAVDTAAQAKSRPLNATITAPLEKSDFAQSPVGDLEADWMRAMVPGANVALVNSTGLRSDLDAGPFTYGRLYDLLPFDNQRVTIWLTGAQLRTVVAENLKRSASMVVLSGVRAAATCEGGQLAVVLRSESGRPVRDTDRLRVVTSDFLATGGDLFLTPVMPVQIEATGDLLRDEIAAFLIRTGGRWGAERRALPPRITHSGPRPVSCAAMVASRP